MMNRTEQKAYKWLLTQGYTEKDIVHQARKTPDFITSDGKGYEVKMLYGKNVIWFFDDQMKELAKMNKAVVLVFDKNSNAPTSIINSVKLVNNAIIDGIKIVSVHKN